RARHAAPAGALPHWSILSQQRFPAAPLPRSRWGQAASKQGMRSGAGYADERRGINKEENVEQAADREHNAKLVRHLFKLSDRLVEIHQFDDVEIIVGADHARDRAKHRKRVQARFYRGEKDIELGKKTGEWRDAGHRE